MSTETRRVQWWRILLPIGILLILFGWLLPRLVDYREVWEALGSLSWPEIAGLVALAAIWSLAEAGVITSLIRGLGVIDGVKAFLSSLTVGAAVPAPWDVLTRYGMYRAYGVEKEPAGTGIVVGGMMTLAVKLGIPLVVLVTWVSFGSPGEDVARITMFAVGAAISVAALVGAAIRFDSFARWFGRMIQSAADRLLPIFGKEPRADLEQATLDFRERLIVTLRSKWPVSFGYAMAAHGFRFGGLLLAFRALGIGTDDAPALLLGAVYAVSLLASMTPMVPAGLGPVELVFIWAFGHADPGLADQVAAAVFLHRAFFWLLPVIVGAWPLVIWARSPRVEAE